MLFDRSISNFTKHLLNSIKNIFQIPVFNPPYWPGANSSRGTGVGSTPQQAKDFWVYCTFTENIFKPALSLQVSRFPSTDGVFRPRLGRLVLRLFGVAHALRGDALAAARDEGAPGQLQLQPVQREGGQSEAARHRR